MRFLFLILIQPKVLLMNSCFFTPVIIAISVGILIPANINCFFMRFNPINKNVFLRSYIYFLFFIHIQCPLWFIQSVQGCKVKKAIAFAMNSVPAILILLISLPSKKMMPYTLQRIQRWIFRQSPQQSLLLRGKYTVAGLNCTNSLL